MSLFGAQRVLLRPKSAEQVAPGHPEIAVVDLGVFVLTLVMPAMGFSHPDQQSQRPDPVSQIGVLEGQMHGGIVHGLGNALMEEAVYDEATGQLLSGTLMDYALPRADDVPGLQVETIATPSPNNFLGLKGMGELPTNGAPAALGNAIVDALRPLGVRHIDMPITAHKIWKALNR